jgi:anti-sigma factor RsiW
MACPELLHTQAYFDGEVTATAAADAQRHIEICAECQALLNDLQQVRALLRGGAERTEVPVQLRTRITVSLERKVPPRAFWIGMLGGVGVSAVAAAVAFLVIGPLFNHGLVRAIVADHSRSLLSAHLIDVVSTDQHTVKPWFAGRTDVSPVVVDFAAQGYRLIGGRIDSLDQRRVPVVVYQHGAHFINVFTWAVDTAGMPRDTTRSGYHLAFWRVGNLEYCAISDTGWNELNVLVTLLRDQGNKQERP